MMMTRCLLLLKPGVLALLLLLTLSHKVTAQQEEILLDEESSSSLLRRVVSHQNEQADVGWPFHHKNQTSTACSTVATCQECTSYRTCHWCDNDSACHAKGSVHGCLIGSRCEDNDNDKKKNETVDGCSVHQTCSECAVSSHFCHWCAHDNACHKVGSVYGCVSGVDCYDNSHCQRMEPEPLSGNKKFAFQQMGPLPLLAIVVVTATLLCCATACCCFASGVKGAYDELADLAQPPPPLDATTPLLRDAAQNEEPRHQNHHFQSSTPSDDAEVARTARRTERAAAREAAREARRSERSVASATVSSQVEEDKKEKPQPAEILGETSSPAVEAENQQEQDAKEVATENDETIQEMQQLLEDDEEAAADDYVRLADIGAAAPEDQQEEPYPSSTSTRRRPRRHMQRLYNACVGCYLVTVAMIAVFAFAAVRFYPKKPVHNICNDEVAWKSLIDSMTSMKATADFEILASIANPNHVAVALDMGKGSFYHDGAFVGTYEIPPVTIAAMAISDILIVATFSPEKWDALSITAEYYRGTLVLQVDAEATIRIPALFDYTFSGDLKGLTVHVNKKSDRRLCHCPQWSDTNKTGIASGLDLPVPHWVEAN